MSLLSIGLVTLACSPGSGPGGDGPGRDGPDGGPGDADGGWSSDFPDGSVEHYLMPEVAHSGFDGTSTYEVPVYTTLEEAVFEIDDTAVATVEPLVLPPELEDVLGSFGKSWAMITTQQAGTTTFTATAGDVTLEASLIVLAYDPAVVAVGSQRYNDPASPNDTDRIACHSCHGQPDGVDHTPLALAYFEDAEILQMVRDGMYPDGGEVNGGNHKWNFTAEEAAGIVPYLRSLQPRGF
ncbi:MAG TPA: cytochrome c [Kofleriaceae bacterium]|nr:cytochrome c [Kofleriaceae bacterium]